MSDLNDDLAAEKIETSATLTGRASPEAVRKLINQATVEQHPGLEDGVDHYDTNHQSITTPNSGNRHGMSALAKSDVKKMPESEERSDVLDGHNGDVDGGTNGDVAYGLKMSQYAAIGGEGASGRRVHMSTPALSHAGSVLGADVNVSSIGGASCASFPLAPVLPHSPNPLSGGESPQIKNVGDVENAIADGEKLSLGEKLKNIFGRRSTTRLASASVQTLSTSNSFYINSPRLSTVSANGKKVEKLNDIFIVKNTIGYQLKDFYNRESLFIPWRGFKSDVSKNFVKFEDDGLERLNFIHSKLGDIASPIDENFSYKIFGLKAYLSVNVCYLCRRKKSCNEDHHLQAILNDLELSKGWNREITTRDLDLTRDFSLVSQNTFPIFNKQVKQNKQLSPTLIFVPDEHSNARVLSFTKMNLDNNHFLAMNKMYYPNGELTGDPSTGFKFDLLNSTPETSIILRICLIYTFLEKRDAL